jgi:hypothetical protein
MVLLLVLSPCAMAQKSLGDLTGPWKLFADDHYVQTREQVTRVYHAFEKHPDNPLLEADRPWEGSTAYLYGTVLPGESGSGYRMWYHAWADREYRMLYATSADGLHWAKPALGQVTFSGSAENNILFRHTHENHSPQVIHTPWDPDPARRYKFIYYEYGRTPPQFTVSGYRGLTSPDGVQWTDVKNTQPILVDHGDVGNFVWDAHRQRYTGWPKKFDEVRGYRRRCVGYSATSDFENWPESKLVLVPDEFDDRWVTADSAKDAHTDFYGLSAFPYESMYIGFLWVFPITDGKNDGPIFVELVTSHDGENWTRQEAPRTPILPLGPDGSWDDGMIFTPNHPLVEGDTIRLYYGGFDVTHGVKGGTAAIGLATLRKDGFASLDAGGTEGMVTTTPLVTASGGLQVNYCATGGSLQAELLDADGNVIPGYEHGHCDTLTGDSVAQPVTWGDRKELPTSGGPIRIRFLLRNASLYAFCAGK